MLDPRTETDVEVLRQAFLLVERHNRLLVEQVKRLTLKLAELEGLDPEQIDLGFLDPLDLEVAAAADRRPRTEGSGDRTEPPKRNGHGPREQPALPFEVEEHELCPEERQCEVCGAELEPMGDQSEDAEEVTVVERSYKLVLHRRKKYRCRCNANVVTAPGPPKLVPGGRYSVDFAVEVAVDKYADHLPLERQVSRMERQGLVVTSATLWDQIEALAGHLEPSWQALGEALLSEPVLHADETGWRLWEPGQRSRCPWTVWSLSSPDKVYHQILSSKSTKAARALFRGYDGIVVADGYEVYRKLAREGPGYRLANCWAHVLRKLRDIEQTEPGRAGPLLALIGDLYEVERQVEGPFPGDDEARRRRHTLRQERSRPILDEIREWAFAQGGLRRSDFGKALRYMLERWEPLTLFLEDPRVPLDNNHAERSLRGVVVGRKYHYGSRSRRGTEVAAILYSLVETAKLCGVDPVAYLRHAALAAIRQPGTVTLPQNLPG